MVSSEARILAFNSGSSSIKFALFEGADAPSQILTGSIERIGLSDSTLKVRGLDEKNNFSRPLSVDSHEAAIEILLDSIEEMSGKTPFSAVGHRLVHGGPKYYEPQLLTSEMADDLRRFGIFDPQHLPDELLLAESFRRRFPNVPQVACFDTAFHHDLPSVSRMLPIPRKYEAKGVRRYGFHGISYSYLLAELTRIDGIQAANGKVIFAHLGNGASLAAVLNGKSVDTTMSFTPASGVLMSTRSGDLDPGLVSYFAQSENMSIDEFTEMVNFRSGLLGVSETSSDMRDLLAHEKHDPRAAEAVAIFCYQIRKTIGAFAAALGGLQTLVFAGGIGENEPLIRARICDELGFLGVQIKESRNMTNAELISSDNGAVKVRVIKTDEELMIAKTVCAVLSID